MGWASYGNESKKRRISSWMSVWWTMSSSQLPYSDSLGSSP